MELNKIQKIAAESIDRDIVLMAGAGTGKTQVLTNRFLNILKSGEDIDSILAITFTKKAAAEMRLKIKKALINSNDSRLIEMQKSISKASIYTIHGFCSELISRYPISVGVDPEYVVLESQDSNKILKSTIEKVVNKNIDSLYNLMFEKKSISTDFLEKELLSNYYEMKNLGYTVSKLKNLTDGILNKIKTPNFSNLIELLNEFSEELTNRSKFKKFIETDEYREFLEEPTVEFLKEIEDNLGTKKGKEDLLEEIKTEIKNMQLSLETKNVEYIELVLRLIDEIDLEYKKAKQKISALDYDDLQEYALKILETVGVQYKYVMVDEFQDTNHIQTKILDLLTKSNPNLNLFVVGDPKQSIYSFRGGSIQTYREYIDKMSACGAEILELTENYRSSKKLIESYNFIFEKLMGDKYSALNANVSGEEKLKILESDNEIKAVADYVEHLISSGVSQGEIAILYRKKQSMEEMERELIKRNIEVSNTSTNFYKNREIQDLIITLKAISNEHDIISHLSYLKMPECGLSEDAIFLLANEYTSYGEWGDDFLNILEKLDQSKFKIAEYKLNRLREYSKVLSLSNLIEKIISELDFYEIAYFFKGEVGIKNLRQLVIYAMEFECANTSNILEFIDHIVGMEIEQEPSDSAVNLITIHKSKGLEYDYVIIMDSDKSYKISNRNNLIEIGSNGVGINIEGRNSIYTMNRREKEEQALEEEIRIFYVACTRAKQVLTFVWNSELAKVPSNTYKELLFDSGIDELEELIFDLQSTEKRAESIVCNQQTVDSARLYNETLIRDRYYDKTAVSEYYSVSQYMLYRENKDLYFKRYVLGNDIELKLGGSIGELDPIIKGNIVHKYAEKPVNEIDLFIEQELLKYGVEYKQEIVEELRKLIDYYNDNAEVAVAKEWEFYLGLENCIVHGFIDEIREVNGCLEIVDLKTGEMNEEKLRHYSAQLQIYTYAYEKITGKRVSSAKVVSLVDKKEYNIDINKEVLERRIIDFENFVKEVQILY